MDATVSSDLLHYSSNVLFADLSRSLLHSFRVHPLHSQSISSGQFLDVVCAPACLPVRLSIWLLVFIPVCLLDSLSAGLAI